MGSVFLASESLALFSDSDADWYAWHSLGKSSSRMVNIQPTALRSGRCSTTGHCRPHCFVALSMARYTQSLATRFISQKIEGVSSHTMSAESPPPQPEYCCERWQDHPKSEAISWHALSSPRFPLERLHIFLERPRSVAPVRLPFFEESFWYWFRVIA